MVGERKWSDLPPELVFSIAERLPLSDYVRFRGVCSYWMWAVGEFGRPNLINFPWLAVVLGNCKSNDVECQQKKHPFFLDGERHYRLPNFGPNSDWVLYHKDGWLVIGLDNLRTCILNPFMDLRFHLPFWHGIIYRNNRIILATTPPTTTNSSSSCTTSSSSSFAAFNIAELSDKSGNFLFFARPGDHRSTLLHRSFQHKFEDVVYHEGRFYAMLSNGNLLVFDLLAAAAAAATTGTDPNSPPPPHLLLAKNSTLTSAAHKSGHQRDGYSGVSLVSSCGYFVIMKFDPDKDDWVRMTDLGGRSLFVDDLQAIVLSCDNNKYSNSKQVPSPRRNCIYFLYPCNGVGVYDVGKGTISLFCSSIPHTHIRLRDYDALPDTFWFMPSPCC